jgi:hypothetical protein
MSDLAVAPISVDLAKEERQQQHCSKKWIIHGRGKFEKKKVFKIG